MARVIQDGPLNRTASRCTSRLRRKPGAWFRTCEALRRDAGANRSVKSAGCRASSTRRAPRWQDISAIISSGRARWIDDSSPFWESIITSLHVSCVTHSTTRTFSPRCRRFGPRGCARCAHGANVCRAEGSSCSSSISTMVISAKDGCRFDLQRERRRHW